MKKNLIISLLCTAVALWTISACSSSNKDGSSQQEKDSTGNTEFANGATNSDAATDSSESNTPVSADEVMKSYSAPAELKYCRQSDEFLFDKIYPIGWSKNGFFAYVKETADEAVGQYMFELIIQNTISDKIVYSWKPENAPDKGSVKEMWKNYAMTFAEKLNEYEIIQQKQIKLESTEFSSGENKFKITVENEMETNPDYGFEVVKSTEIFIKSPQLGSKKIYSYTENDYSLTLAAKVSGVIKSPYEERCAVVVQTERSGYEGPPNVISVFLTGTNLTETFRK